MSRRAPVPLAVVVTAISLAGLLPACRSSRIERVAAGPVESGPPLTSVESEPVPDLPPREPIAPPEPPPEPPVPAMQRGDEAWLDGDLKRALGAYREALKAGEDDADRALFRIASIHLLEGGPAFDRERGLSLLERVLREHPASPWVVEARLLLSLSDDVDRLRHQLEELKLIDLEGRRRVPG